MASNPATSSRVFIDSSVLIAASISGTGFARDLVLMGVDGLVQLVASDFVLGETRRNLLRKSPDAVTLFDTFLALEVIEMTNPPDTLVQEIAHRVEPKDAAIVAGAIAAVCPVVASFDRRHLLAEAEQIQQLWSVRVETPKEIVERLIARLDND